MYCKEGPTTRKGGTKTEQGSSWSDAAFITQQFFLKATCQLEWRVFSLQRANSNGDFLHLTCSPATLQTSPLAYAWNSPVKLATPLAWPNRQWGWRH